MHMIPMKVYYRHLHRDGSDELWSIGVIARLGFSVDGGPGDDEFQVNMSHALESFEFTVLTHLISHSALPSLPWFMTT